MELKEKLMREIRTEDCIDEARIPEINFDAQSINPDCPKLEQHVDKSESKSFIGNVANLSNFRSD